MMTMNVNGFVIYNTANYAKDKKYIVARYDNDKFWFWGAWDNEKKANIVAKKIGGVVFNY